MKAMSNSANVFILKAVLVLGNESVDRRNESGHRAPPFCISSDYFVRRCVEAAQPDFIFICVEINIIMIFYLCSGGLSFTHSNWWPLALELR